MHLIFGINAKFVHLIHHMRSILIFRILVQIILRMLIRIVLRISCKEFSKFHTNNTQNFKQVILRILMHYHPF